MLLVPACGSSDHEERVLKPPGTFTLAWLGHGDQVLVPGSSRIASVEVPYSLAQGARQGRPTWYKIRLHYRLAISNDSGPGTITVWASTNGEPVAAIDFRTSRKGRALEVESSSVGLVDGSRRTAGARLVWNGVFTNFLVLGGVRTGVNRLRFDVQESGAARAESLTVYEDTAIVVDGRGPATIDIVPSLVDRDIHVGEPFLVRYTIRNSGGVALTAGGTLSIRVPDGVLAAGDLGHRLRRLRAGETLRGEFRLVARRPGRHRIELTTSTWGGSPSVTLAAQVEP